MCACNSMSSKILSLRSVINIIAYGGANLGRIAVPQNVLKFSHRTKRNVEMP